ncbi:unnamed protein product [Rhizophagus irregularis]|uniref:Uncharacterized protein n=1 Tax=Rhizophagus irregularis TaxID=588596 RepID=A0A915ZV27_9GLOM|nr:unnamed protein product [Rhizophagus irregularis]
MNNITAVFTHCNKANMENPDRLIDKLTYEQTNFLEKINKLKLVCEIQNIKSQPEVDQALNDYEVNSVQDNAKQVLLDKLEKIPETNGLK